MRLPPLPARLRPLLLLAALAGADDAAAQEADHALAARLRLGAERVRLPAGEDVGLAGLTELLSLGEGWWAGPGVYGAATGQRGGLFVPGVEVAWSRGLNGWLALDAGLFAGGGGGGNAPVGGGLMLRPHAGLLFQLPGLQTGPTWSRVRFPNGSIDSRQVGWVVQFDSSFRFRTADGTSHGQLTDGRATGLGFDRIDVVAAVLRPHHALDTQGAPLTQRLGLVGVRAERDIDGPWWAGIETAGAAKGGVAGYAEVLGTTGLRWPLFDGRLGLGARAAAGLAGGGGVDTGGGVLLKGAAGLEWHLSDMLGLGAEATWARAPTGRFTARGASVSLDWTLAPPRRPPGDALDARTVRMEFEAGVEHYRAARRTGGGESLDAVMLQVNRFVSPHIYLAGQLHSAFSGGAGAYSAGLVGAGAQWPVASGARLGAEALIGAAGGGGVDTCGGAIGRVRGYLDLALTPSIGLRAGAGRIKAAQGGLDATAIDAALVFRFGADAPAH